MLHRTIDKKPEKAMTVYKQRQVKHGGKGLETRENGLLSSLGKKILISRGMVVDEEERYQCVKKVHARRREIWLQCGAAAGVRRCRGE